MQPVIRLLVKKAEEAGIIYSMAAGDQPSLIAVLCDWARCTGFDIVCAGKGTKYLPVYHKSTPETVWGQFGFIEFHTDCRFPRHIHMIRYTETGEMKMLPERILVLNDVGITELCGEYFVVAPGSLVDIPVGVPHTWNACPAGVKLPDGTVSDGHFRWFIIIRNKLRCLPKQTSMLPMMGTCNQSVFRSC